MKTPVTPINSKFERAAEAILARYIHDLLRAA
jgi:hypothetical protein